MLYNTAVFTLGYKVLRKGLTPAGVAHAWFLGASIFSAFGAGGYSLVCLYFLFGTLVSYTDKIKSCQASLSPAGVVEAVRPHGPLLQAGLARSTVAVRH